MPKVKNEHLLDTTIRELAGFPGKRGKSIVEKIREALDETYVEWRDRVESPEPDFDPMFVPDFEYSRGIARALGILRGTTEEHEMSEAEERYEP
jgi:hypothetical protein